MAKKKKRSERASFLFDEEAGADGGAINLFGPDEEPAADEDPTEEEPAYEDAAAESDAPSDEPEEPNQKDKPSATPQFRFDRYGRRIGKRGARYGKRKNAPKATTTVVEHETEAKREYDEARARSEARAKKRAREEAKAAAIRRTERKNRRRRSFSTFVLGALALGVLVVLTLFVTRVSKVHVVNVPQGYTEERIVELSGLSSKIGKNSALFISTKNVEQTIRKSDPYLDATVRYAFPSTINITVSKRTEAACVRWGPQNEYLAIIDENGTVLNEKAESTNGLLIADGMNVSSASNGARLGDSGDVQVAALIRILIKLKESGLLERSPRISRIDMTELMQIRMYLEGMPYTIEVGDTTNLDTKLEKLQRHWTVVMDEASTFIRNGRTTVTIYLYSKGGINVSPYEPGYAMPTTAPASPSATSLPGDGTDPGNTEPTETPGDEPYEPQPQVTPMPHQDDPFTG